MGLELFLIAVGLSMDAFAVAVCHGLTMKKMNYRKALIVGLYFGAFQGIMPLVGYLAASRFSDMIVNYDHWIAFALLGCIGAKMIWESFTKEGCPDRECPVVTCTDRDCPGDRRPHQSEALVTPAVMVPLAFATSVDALAVGISFAFLQVDIIPAVSWIGLTTLVLSVAGVSIGFMFGTKFKSKAELAGGLILILMGVKILLEHLGIISF